jgi:hypothetical protein
MKTRFIGLRTQDKYLVINLSEARYYRIFPDTRKNPLGYPAKTWSESFFATKA